MDAWLRHLRVWFSFSVLSQEIGWTERLWNDLFCVGWDVKSQLSQSINDLPSDSDADYITEMLYKDGSTLD